MKRSRKQTEYQTALKKFLEESKEPLKRLKLLKHGLEKSSLDEVKQFYKMHASTVFYVVYGSFTQVEQTIIDRTARGKDYSETYLRDLIETVLPSLEHVIVVLPEMIHMKWQYNSICFIIKKLLHPDNHKKLRQYGIKLLTLWLQALQENASDACMELFASAIPHFPPRKTPEGLPVVNPSASLPATLSPTSDSTPSGLSDRYGVYASPKGGELSTHKCSSSMNLASGSALRDVIKKPQLPPLHPHSPSDGSTETMTLDLMEYLLKCLTSQVDLLYWDDPSNYVRGFAFLFFSFKLFYLACLYKDFRSASGLYSPSDPPEIKLPSPDKEVKSHSLDSVNEEGISDDSLGDQSSSEPQRKLSPSLFKRRRAADQFRLSSVIKLDYDLSDPIYTRIKDLILKHVLMWVLPSNIQQRGGGISGSPAPSPLLPRRPKFVPSGIELIRDMWFTSRDNVSMLLEICRQGFQTPLLQTYILRKLIELYFHWEQTSKKPLFMQQPPVRSVGEVTSDLSTTTEGHSNVSKDPGGRGEGGAMVDQSVQSQSNLSVLSWEQLSGYAGFTPLDVQAGLQASLRMFVLHTNQVFFRDPANFDELLCQVELCRKVIRLYQDIAVSWVMNKDTWEYMLAVILHITLELLKGGPPDNRDSTLGGLLASTLLKTLLVCYLRASMVFNVSPQLWDNLLAVLSSLTQWKEVVITWKQIMDSITQVLAQTVYDLNILDLPLDRLELEDHHRLQQKSRLKSQDHMTSATPRTSSFATINVVPSRREMSTYTPPIKHPRIVEGGERSTSSVGDAGAKRRRERLVKAHTEDSKGSPPIVLASETKRFSTPDHGPALRNMQPRLLVKVPTIEEEEGGGAKGDSSEVGESSVTIIPPRRSSSSIGQVPTRKLSDGGELEEGLHSGKLLEPRAMSSPGATSLPPEMLFDAIPESTGESGEHEPPTNDDTAGSCNNILEGDDGKRSAPTTKTRSAESAVKDPPVGVSSAGDGGSGQEVEGRAVEEDSVIVNVHAKSTSPEPVPDASTSDDTNLAIASKDKTKATANTTGTSTRSSKTTSPEIVDGAEGKEGGKGHSKAKRWNDIFHWKSQTVDRRRAKSMHGRKAPVAPADLILTNKAFAKDSLTPEPQVIPKKLLCRSDSDTSNLRSKAETAKSTRSVEIDGASVRGSPLHRSLSDSNIPFLISAEKPGASPSSSLLNSNALDDTNLQTQRSHISLRRVVSSGATSSQARDRNVEESMHDKVLDDQFSASIIPLSHDGIPKVTSPARHLPLMRTKLHRSATVAEENLDETNKRVPLLAEDTERDIVSKSPPSMVLSPTSPVQSSVLSASPQGVGWTPVIAAVIWCRMLRILGDINEIQDPYIHSEAMVCLQDTWKALSNIAANSGIALGAQPTPSLPEYMPPLTLLLPWVVKACSLSQQLDSGCTKAYQLLCEMTIYHWHTPPTSLHLTHFYRLMHAGLQPSAIMLPVAVKYGSKIFSHGLSGSSILITDCIQACSTLLSKRRSSDSRIETLHLLGSMLFLPELYSYDLISSLMTPSEVDGQSEAEIGTGPEGSSSVVGVATIKGVRGIELREQIIGILFESAKREPMRICRCVLLYQLGMLLYSELNSGRPSRRLPEGIEILLASLQFADRSVSMAAIDMTCLLLEVSGSMKQLYPSMPAKVLEALCYAIAVFIKDEQEKVTWVDKIVVTLIHCLRDWLLTLPIQKMISEGSLLHSTVNSIFEVLQTAAGTKKQSTVKVPVRSQHFTIRNPVSSVQLSQLDTANTKSPRGQPARTSRGQINLKRSGEDVQLSSERTNVQDEDRVQTAARSVLTHLLNLLGHFPFGCGAAQMNSVVTEFHDCPSLQHLDELSTEIFDSPRVQFFSFNNSAVVTLVEIPTKMDGVPSSVATASFQTRIIVRDVTGKYTWDCAVLYGPEPPPSASVFSLVVSQGDSDSSQLESGAISAEASEVTLTDALETSPGKSPLEPPSWRSHANTDRDVLEDLLSHIETTSPECLLFPGQVGMCEPVPVGGGAGGGDSLKELEEMTVKFLIEQHSSEQGYIKEAFTLPSMKGEKAAAPTHFPNTLLPFHYCRIFLSHLGMFSWAKRSHLDLLEKNNQLILELKHLDSIQTQCRQTYKVAVLYVAPGQEDKMSILSNSYGSHQYEDFIAGIGWEVEMKSHRGYMGGLKREFCSDCSLPYYATSSEEVLFHVATRMPMKVDQIIRHLGNDEVHIVWSEHWRDYRRTIFKTQFADVLIIVYPLPTGLFRIQIQKKPNVPLFGPLFDGALVDRSSLSALVRATALNALRAQRSPLIGYRGRYEERMKYIRTLTDVKLQSSFENFAENVMHPLEMSSKQSLVSSSALRSSPQKVLSSRTSIIAAPVSVQSHLHTLGQSDEKLTVSGRFRQALDTLTTFSPPRPRSSTNDERMMCHSPEDSGANDAAMHRNQSMPDQLNEVGVARMTQKSQHAIGTSLFRPNNGSQKPSPKSSSGKYNLSDSHLLSSVKRRIHNKPNT